jgi:hypothetical protein
MADDIFAALAAATNPAEKAALIAEMNLDDLPPSVTLAARRAVILHWFNAEVLAALLPADSDISAADVYRHLADLPFIEQLPYGLAYHSLTRAGLLTRYTADQPDLLRQAAALAAPVYAAAEDKTIVLEGLYCYTLAGVPPQPSKYWKTCCSGPPDESTGRPCYSFLPSAMKRKATPLSPPCPVWRCTFMLPGWLMLG